MLLKDKIVIVSGIGPGLGIELALLSANDSNLLRICDLVADDREEEMSALSPCLKGY